MSRHVISYLRYRVRLGCRVHRLGAQVTYTHLYLYLTIPVRFIVWGLRSPIPTYSMIPEEPSDRRRVTSYLRDCELGLRVIYRSCGL